MVFGIKRLAGSQDAIGQVNQLAHRRDNNDHAWLATLAEPVTQRSDKRIVGHRYNGREV